MKVEEEVLLSYYREVEKINNRADISLVRHVESGQLFIKKILPVSSAAVYRKLMEINATGIPEIFNVIEDDDSVIVIEELINGITIHEHLETGGLFSPEQAVDIICSLCRILRNFHNSKPPVIHRDIKPSNVLIDAEYNVTLIDFDASKLFDKGKSRDTVLMGTAAFAAPEQFGYSQSDARTDIYALGALLNVMLTGSVPSEKLFDGGCSSVIRKCTAMDPDDRYPTVDSLMKSLLKSLKWSAPKLTPPGFRTGKVWKMIVASFGYVGIILSCCWMTFEAGTPEYLKWASRIAAFLCMSAIVIFALDYCSLSSRLPVSRSSNIFISCLGRLLWICLSIILVLGLLTTVGNF